MLPEITWKTVKSIEFGLDVTRVDTNTFFPSFNNLQAYSNSVFNVDTIYFHNINTEINDLKNVICKDFYITNYMANSQTTKEIF